ncbi:MAG: hypothetical protein KDC07_07255 [Chitinophagaceae bacterium]|nr:hypothetical protein [Chitinophagaceae bacterium]
MANAQSSILILGTAQDGGYPHIGCQKQCCQRVWNGTSERRYVVSFALIDPETKHWWMFEATPDIKEQLQYFNKLTNGAYKYLPDGIFLTHAHMGHYTGLMQLGREALGTKGVKVYTLPKMRHFLENNGPWDQLIKLHNIDIQTIKPNSITGLGEHIKVLARTVPHRDEYSETAGFTIITPGKRYLFIPDINKWDKWDRDIINEVKDVDIALLDATFYDETELPGRRMEEVPHPFVEETMQLFNRTDKVTKAKIYFIHFNHTNPLLWDTGIQTELGNAGFNCAKQGTKL